MLLKIVFFKCLLLKLGIFHIEIIIMLALGFKSKIANLIKTSKIKNETILSSGVRKF